MYALAGTVSLQEVMKFVSKANDEASETMEFAKEVGQHAWVGWWLSAMLRNLGLSACVISY